MVLLSAQKMPVAKIAEVTFTSEDRVRDVIHNFNADGFDSLYPKYAGGRPRTFNLPERREIKKIAKSKPSEHGLPFSTWSLSKLADFLVAEGVVDDISHEGLRVLLRDEGVSFQRIKTWKTSKDPEYQVKKARVEHLYAIADGEVIPEDGDPEVVVCLDEFGPLNLMPIRDANGPNAAGYTRIRTVLRARVAGPPTTATTGSGICSPPTISAATGCSGTSSSTRSARSSWSSAGIYGPCTRSRCGWRSSATTSHRT
jgi:transposase